MAKAKPQKGAQEAEAPAFSQAMLSQLTEKINKGLEQANANKAQNGKRKRGAEVVEEQEPSQKASKAPKRADKKSKSEKKSADKEKKPEKKPESNAESKPEKTKVEKEKTKTEKEKTKAGTSKDVILEEIRLLGGDEGDLELVTGIDSDAEEGAGKADASADLALDEAFKSELAMFAAGLGFDEVREEDEEDEVEEKEKEIEEEKEDEEEEAKEDEKEDEENEDEDDEDDEDEDDEAEEEADVKQPPVQEKPRQEPKPAALEPLIPRNPKFAKLTFEPRPDWHQVALDPLPAPVSDDIARLSSTMAALQAYAKTLLEADSTMYRNISASSSSHRFMSTIMSSGTMSDKVSALTLEVQEAPVHNTKAFENLLGLAAKRSRGQAMAALGALVDLLGNGVVLPSDRRLRAFFAQPGLIGTLQAQDGKEQKGHHGYKGRNDKASSTWNPSLPLPAGITKAHLIQWAFEDWLKDAFFRMLQSLEVWCNDEIEYTRTRSIDFIFALLRDKPEQEANLLRLLVNKLGDRERKISSRASYLLLQLLNVHPAMKPIVVHTIEQEILSRPGQSLRAKYYAINTLNQTILSTKEPAIADTLVRVYFELFLALLKSGALGAIDFSNATDDIANGEKKAKGKDKRGHDKDKDGKDGKDGKAKEKKEKEDNTGNERDISEKLVSSLLTGVNRAIPFANTDDSTLEKHIDTLFRITHSSNFNTSIQALMLVQQVAVSKQIAVDRFYRTLYESLLDPRLVTSSKQAMYLNLLFRALKNDIDVRRVKAFAKRMLQISTLHQPPFVCGILFLIAELETAFPDLKSLLTEPELHEEDEEEVYRDVIMGEDGQVIQPAVEEKPKKAPQDCYDGRKRDPEYSNAHKSCLWELIPYFRHFHPSVMAFASNLLVRQTSLPKPDMANHTLMHFLDKFVYRNPKAAATATDGKLRGASIMQPLASATSNAATSANGAAQIVASAKATPQQKGAQEPASVNSAAFWNKKVKDVAVEDVFFHAYFAQVGKPAQASRAAKRAAKKTQDTGDGAVGLAEEDDEGEDEEEEIWQALKTSRPEVDADDDADMDDLDDDDMSGLESLLEMSDSDDEGMDGMDDMDDMDGMEVDDDEGGVEFADFSEEEEEGEEDKEKPAAVNGWKEARNRKKELKALPTFASVDDYAEMLAQEEDEQYL